MLEHIEEDVSKLDSLKKLSKSTCLNDSLLSFVSQALSSIAMSLNLSKKANATLLYPSLFIASCHTPKFMVPFLDTTCDKKA